MTVRTVMLEQQVDFVAEDFNGLCGNDTSLPVPLGSPPLWGAGALLGELADVCVCFYQVARLPK